MCCFIFLLRLHILPKVSRGNDQSSTKVNSKLIVSFAEGSGKYKLIECKGDSSVACTFNKFICFFLSLLFWLFATSLLNTLAEKKKRKCHPKRGPKNTSNEDKHYMICTGATTKLRYILLQTRGAKCLCSISSKVVLKERVMLHLINL